MLVLGLDRAVNSSVQACCGKFVDSFTAMGNNHFLTSLPIEQNGYNIHVATFNSGSPFSQHIAVMNGSICTEVFCGRHLAAT
jgi:hypothetical protein